jgi:hypothetical protein
LRVFRGPFVVDFFFLGMSETAMATTLTREEGRSWSGGRELDRVAGEMKRGQEGKITGSTSRIFGLETTRGRYCTHHNPILLPLY